MIGPAGETTLEVQSSALGSLAVPLDGILGLVLAPPLEPDAAHALATRRPRRAAVDRGPLARQRRPAAGGLLGLDDKKVAFQPPTGKVELDRAGVVALGLRPEARRPIPRPDGPFLELTLVDGSRLGVTDAPRRAEARSSRRPASASRSGCRWASWRRSTSRAARSSTSRIAPPDVEKYVGYVGPTRPVRRDLAIDGQPLRLGGKAYDRGLGTQSRSYLRLSTRARRQAVPGPRRARRPCRAARQRRRSASSSTAGAVRLAADVGPRAPPGPLTSTSPEPRLWS